MNRINIKEQILNLFLLLLVQLPLIHRVTFLDYAHGFFYVGFILLLPQALNRSYLMIIGFVSGLVIDIFCNTPGIHASASVFIMFVRNLWLGIANNDDRQELTNLNVATLNKLKFLYFIYPLVFVHHFILFVLEDGGFHLFRLTISRIFFSSIFSTIIIFAINFMITSNKRRT